MVRARVGCKGERVRQEGGGAPAHAREGRDEGVRLFDDHAVGVGTPAPQKERYAPKHASIPTLAVGVYFVAGGLVCAWRPEERALPPADRQQRRDVSHVMHAWRVGFTQVHG
eukprot:3576508-Pleurochrysis_carterae.AAC.1